MTAAFWLRMIKALCVCFGGRSFFSIAALMLFLKVAVFDMLYGAFFVLTHAIVLRGIDVVSQSPQCIYARFSSHPTARPQRSRTDRVVDRGPQAAAEGFGN